MRKVFLCVDVPAKGEGHVSTEKNLTLDFDRGVAVFRHLRRFCQLNDAEAMDDHGFGGCGNPPGQCAVGDVYEFLHC